MDSLRTSSTASSTGNARFSDMDRMVLICFSVAGEELSKPISFSMTSLAVPSRPPVRESNSMIPCSLRNASNSIASLSASLMINATCFSPGQ